MSERMTDKQILDSSSRLFGLATFESATPQQRELAGLSHKAIDQLRTDLAAANERAEKAEAAAKIQAGRAERLKHHSDVFERDLDGLKVKHSTTERYAAEITVEVEQLRKIVEQLRKIVEKLPVTADGVSVIPYMDFIYHPSRPTWSLQAYGDKEQSAMDVCRPASDCAMKHIVVPVSECYSTREAAEAAHEGGEE